MSASVAQLDGAAGSYPEGLWVRLPPDARSRVKLEAIVGIGGQPLAGFDSRASEPNGPPPRGRARSLKIWQDLVQGHVAHPLPGVFHVKHRSVIDPRGTGGLQRPVRGIPEPLLFVRGRGGGLVAFGPLGSCPLHFSHSFQGGEVVTQAAVNRPTVGSIPTPGAMGHPACTAGR